MKLGVSIVICCYNSAKRLPITLQYLAQQQYDMATNWEIIVVDNASVDHTSRVAKETWESFNIAIKLYVVSESRPGLGYARACGIAHSRYEFISFIDDDNLVSHHWVQSIYGLLTTRSEIGLIGSKNIPAFEGVPPAWFHRFAYLYAVGEQQVHSGLLKNKFELWGAGLTIRKSAWLKLNKCAIRLLLDDRKANKLTSGGDSEVCMVLNLLGFQLYYAGELTLHHLMPQARLHWNYTQKLLKGLANARFTLAVYTELCQGNLFAIQRPKQYLFRFYVKNILAAFYGWTRWKLSFKSKCGNNFYAKFVFYKEVLKGRSIPQDLRIIHEIHQNYTAIQNCY